MIIIWSSLIGLTLCLILMTYMAWASVIEWWRLDQVSGARLFISLICLAGMWICTATFWYVVLELRIK